VVGGFTTRSTVTRDGIEAEVIYQWPDAVGAFIDAEAVGSSVSRAQPLPSVPEAVKAYLARCPDTPYLTANPTPKGAWSKAVRSVVDDCLRAWPGLSFRA
jgi:hypothetical protein